MWQYSGMAKVLQNIAICLQILIYFLVCLYILINQTSSLLQILIMGMYPLVLKTLVWKNTLLFLCKKIPATTEILPELTEETLQTIGIRSLGQQLSIFPAGINLEFEEPGNPRGAGSSRVWGQGGGGIRVWGRGGGGRRIRRSRC